MASRTSIAASPPLPTCPWVGRYGGFYSLFANNVGWGRRARHRGWFVITTAVLDKPNRHGLQSPAVPRNRCRHRCLRAPRQRLSADRSHEAFQPHGPPTSSQCPYRARRVNRRVVDARPSSVVAGKNRANDSSSIVLGYETGVGIAFEKRLYCILAIVYIPHGETCASCPQSVYQRIILDFHMAYGHCYRFGHISFFPS